MQTGFFVLGIIVLLVLWVIAAYNGLVRNKTRVDEAWSDIDVQLKRRYDLIPNLVETVKGYAAHENEVFTHVMDARAKALGAQSVPEKAAAENMMTGALKSIFALAEAYPQLRAVESFTKLQEELADTENKIQAARRFYNGNARDFNAQIAVFPTNLFAHMFGFTAREYFEIANAEEKEPVKVSF
ncbi:MAG: LemA family protein [Patescibacteria group bacterium]|nr:LemA family protein [Patescibacteria group bacterium]MDE2438282.1 LemA family protein [Patescibacteria group bacterium]